MMKPLSAWNHRAVERTWTSTRSLPPAREGNSPLVQHATLWESLEGGRIRCSPADQRGSGPRWV